MVGIIDKDDEQRFKRMIFRVTKGNEWVHIKDTDEEVVFDMKEVTLYYLITTRPSSLLEQSI